MTDVFSKAKRSEVMSRIRSRGNKDTELALARVLRANGIKGWRRQVLLKLCSSRGNEALTGRASSRSLRILDGASSRRLLQVMPDFVFLKSRTAIFVDGCFWHGCPRHATKPKNNRAFWRRKLASNKRRDRLVNRALRRAGWRVLRVWEHELRRGKTNIEHPTSNTEHRMGAEARLVRRIQQALGG